MINVSEAIDSDTGEKVTVRRYAAGGYVNGLWVAGSTSTFNTLASVQQPTPKQLQMLPEGERGKDIRLFITRRAIYTSRDRDGLSADEVYYKGNYYKLIDAADWDSFGHTTAMGARVA